MKRAKGGGGRECKTGIELRDRIERLNGGGGERKFEPPRLVLLRDFDKML